MANDDRKPAAPLIRGMPVPNDLRDRGWSVDLRAHVRLDQTEAIHIIVTRPIRLKGLSVFVALKGAGEDDSEALDQIRSQVAVLDAVFSSPEEGAISRAKIIERAIAEFDALPRNLLPDSIAVIAKTFDVDPSIVRGILTAASLDEELAADPGEPFPSPPIEGVIDARPDSGHREPI